MTTGGADIWVCIHGTKPNSDDPRSREHEQHLILCTEVPQDRSPSHHRRPFLIYKHDR